MRYDTIHGTVQYIIGKVSQSQSKPFIPKHKKTSEQVRWREMKKLSQNKDCGLKVVGFYSKIAMKLVHNKPYPLALATLV